MSLEVGAVQNGKQSVTIGNQATGRYKTVISTPEKVDEFVRSYDSIGQSSTKKTFAAMIIPALAGFVGGVVKNAKMAGLGIGLIVGGVLGMVTSLIGHNKQEKLANTFINENS